MSVALLAFAAGVLLLQQQAVLPPPAWIAALPLAAAGAAFALGRAAGGAARRRRAWLAASVGCAAAGGFLWADALAQLRLADRLAAGLEGRDLTVTGVVAGLPALGTRAVRFAFDLEQPAGLPRRVLLSWYRPRGAGPVSPVHPGERWRLSVRLRRPHGQVNPHGFDYEAWLMERGIGATGYVRGSVRLGARNGLGDRIEQAREAVRARFERVLGKGPATGILVALAVGDQRSIPAAQWRLFNRTAVTHLMRIDNSTYY